MDSYFFGALSSVFVIGLFCWIAKVIIVAVRNSRDRQKVYLWLKTNTRDEPGQCHRDIRNIAEGTRLPEYRAYEACMSDDRIYYDDPEKPEKWGLWPKWS